MASTAAVLAKVCSKCGAERPLDEFYRRADSKDGRSGWCRDCARTYYSAASRKWNEENRERRRELDRKRYQADPERHRATKRAYDERNREAINARARERYADGGRERAQAYRAKNPERGRAAVRRCYRKNRAKRLDWAHRRRLIEVEGAVPPEKIDALLGQPCAYCGATENIELDHIVPIARGGAHDLENLAPACLPCNRSKGAKLLSEWRAES